MVTSAPYGIGSVASLGKAVRSPVIAKPRSAIANNEPGFAWRSREQEQGRSLLCFVACSCRGATGTTTRRSIAKPT